ncbi:MAG: rhamnan synthesis F family protein [Pseudoclavibacter sp.]|nr:rhamnan synthesis F family protein [Pseudoclavibacter sp.]
MSARVDIVMRTRDRPLLLRRALRSVAAQRFPDYRLVIVNDRGEREPVERLVAAQPEAVRERIELVHNSEDHGREGAMNVGVRAGRAEFVAIHDDDDAWHPDFLERTVAALDADRSACAVAVRTEVVFERVEGERIVEERRETLAPEMHEVTLVDMIRADFAPPISILFRRSIYDEVGPIDESLPVLADWDFALRMLRRAPIGFLDGEALAFWHQRPQSGGAEGNSVVVERSRHEHYEKIVRDRFFRESLAGSDQLGVVLALSHQLAETTRRLSESDRILGEAIGRVERGVNRIARYGLPHAAAVDRMVRLARRGPGRSASPVRRAPSRAVEAAAPRPLDAPTPPASGGRDGGGPLPEGARRLVIYMVFDPAGRIDDYIPYKLRALREHAEHILVVFNGTLSEQGRAALAGVADTVLERENTGFDVGAYREAQERFGWERLAGYDELVLMNYTFFGPVHPFGEVFGRMAERDLDFWGLTEHEAYELGGGRVMPAHLQSHWIAVRGRMLRSPEYREYWETMPQISSYEDSIEQHETRFTRHFAERGFRYEAAWPASDYPSQHPVFDDIVRMLDDRLPIVKRRLFFHDPLYLDRFAIIGRDALERVEAAGYPMELLWRNIVRGAEPRVLAANAQTLSILSDRAPEPTDAAPPSIAVLAHLYYDEMADELFDRIDMLPGPPRVVVTTSDEERRARIAERLGRRGYAAGSEVRIVESNRGRDVSAFYVGCRDVLTDPGTDLIVKVHGKRSVQDGANAGSWFKRHLLENLLPSPGYAANLVRLFQEDPTIGLVFPPIVHIGYPTLGHAWFENREPAAELARRLGIRVPLDRDTPLAPLGSMFVARREALAPIAEAGFRFQDFPEEGEYGDGALSHVLERLVGYAAAERGLRIHTVMSARMAEISHSMLEYKLQALSRYLPGYAIEQVPFLKRVLTGRLSPVTALKNTVAFGSPGAARRLLPAYRALRGAVRRLRRR